MSRSAISAATGIDEASLSRFVNGKSGLRLKALDKLAELLGWNLAEQQTKQPEATPNAAKPKQRSRKRGNDSQ